MTGEPHVTAGPVPQAAAEPAGPAGRDRPAWPRRGTLALIAALAGLSYAWALGQDPLEPYYAAAVRSMSMSWHNFVYGAFDPAGTITLDKLPGAFWIQALAVRAFGVHTWVIVAPQAAEGVLTVLVLYRAVQRLAGPAAGLIAAAVLAVSPATVALNRGNISDSLMILLLVLAADAVSAAIATGSWRRLLLAGLWVGLAFQAKMIEAWLVLPAFGLAYLVSGPGPAWRRVRQLAAAGALAGVVSLSWMTAVSLTPAAGRPYVDGSHDDSLYQQVFVYNGFGRFGDQTPLQLLAGQTAGTTTVLTNPAPAPDRLLRGELGRDTGWLLPAALIAGAWGLASRRRRPRGDPLRACFVLWEAWLVTLAVTFSLTTTINPYYTAALTPAVAALLGAGVAAVWPAGPSASQAGQASQAGGQAGAQAGDRSAHGWRAGRIGLAALVAATAGYAGWLVASAGSQAPGWLLPAVIAAGVAAVAVALASAAVRGRAPLAAALAAGLVAGCAAPAVASATLVARHQGAFDTPFESAREAGAIDLGFLRTPARIARTIPGLQGVQFGAPYLLATQTSLLASEFIWDSGLEALPIGGFTGTIPSPTLRQLQADIAAGKFHLVVAVSLTDPRLRWIAAHCRHVGRARGHTYFCLPADAVP
jgi:4-amino-4-deoxy-L-arabinose transferase-like glycosyltransferase